MSQGPGVVEVFTDGSYTGKRGRGFGGLGVWWGGNDPRNLSERCPDSREGSSMLSELHAFRRLLEQLVDPANAASVCAINKLMVGIDCENVLKLFTFYRRRFRKSGFVKKDGNPITHVKVVRYITALLEYAERLVEIELYHIGGHNGSEGNEGADILAKRGAARSWVPPEPDWDILERSVRKKLADLKAAEDAQRKRKPADEAASSRKKLREDVVTERKPLPLLHPTPVVSTNIAFSRSSRSSNARSVVTRGSMSDNSDNGKLAGGSIVEENCELAGADGLPVGLMGSSSMPTDISDDETDKVSHYLVETTSDNSSQETPETSSAESSQASTSSTLWSTDSDLPSSSLPFPKPTRSNRMTEIQHGLAMKAAARERRRLEIEAALASVKEAVPASEQGNDMGLQLKTDQSLLTSQTSTSSVTLGSKQITTSTMAVLPGARGTSAMNTDFALVKDLEPTQSIEKNVRTSSPLIYTPEELVYLASVVDDLDKSDTDVDDIGSGPDKASQVSTSSSIYTPEELAALADIPDDDWDDIDSDVPGHAKTSQTVTYTDEELAEMAACLDDSSDFELDD